MIRAKTPAATVGYVLDRGHLVHASCRGPYELERNAGKMFTPEAVVHKWTGQRCAFCHGTGPEPAQRKRVEPKATQFALFAGARVAHKELDLFGEPTKSGARKSAQGSLF